MRPDRGQTLANAPLADLLTILLRQFKRPLATQGVTLTDADASRIAAELVSSAPESDERRTLREAMLVVIHESEAVLARWSLTFEQALDTPMDKLEGWESTAEFLDLANEKTNAELRIAAGVALLTALGDARYAERLRFLHRRDRADPDAQIGQRILDFKNQ
jgi:hypothetical protein